MTGEPEKSCSKVDFSRRLHTHSLPSTNRWCKERGRCYLSRSVHRRSDGSTPSASMQSQKGKPLWTPST
nr:MAG TPA: hypothetical protein [Caudoviricetes sp.]